MSRYIYWDAGDYMDAIEYEDTIKHGPEAPVMPRHRCDGGSFDGPGCAACSDARRREAHRAAAPQEGEAR